MLQKTSIEGTLLGEAVGDALGLAREGLTSERAEALFGPAPFEHTFIWGCGMVSDDTEHACMTAQALLAHPVESESFARSLGWRLRGWLLGLPAGVGWATLRSIVRLWMGFSAHSSGVFSAGNGPAMRSPILGVCLGHDIEQLKAYVRVATSITHTDEKAYEAALVIALAAFEGAQKGPEHLEPSAFFELCRTHIKGSELLEHLTTIESLLAGSIELDAVVQQLGWDRGITGYINHTVPACLYAWLQHLHSFRDAVECVISWGGDSDTTAAIVGALSGATLGAQAIPESWSAQIVERPRSVSWIQSLATQLVRVWNEPSQRHSEFSPDLKQSQTVPLFWPLLPLRNAFFMWVVLMHGFRRIFPPYTKKKIKD